MKTREKENIEAVRKFYQALTDGNEGYAHTLLDPNIEWIEQAEELYFSGRHVGRQLVFDEVIEPTRDKIKDFRFRPKKFFAVGDRVIVLGQEAGCGRVTHLELKASVAHIWTIQKSKPVRFEAFHDVLEWQVVLGLTSVQAPCLAA